MKLHILGHKRHGKTTAGDILQENFDLKYRDSSEAACEIAVYPFLKDEMKYTSWEQCFLDRHRNDAMRARWYDLISEFNREDPARLSMMIFKDNDIYVGIRSRREFLATRHLINLTIWIDASERMPPEDPGSCTVVKDDCDIIVENNGDEPEFRDKIMRLGKILFAKKMETE